jgi:hypothetical protein
VTDRFSGMARAPFLVHFTGVIEKAHMRQNCAQTVVRMRQIALERERPA